MQAGEISRSYFPRSAIKFLQALPLLQSGAAQAYNLNPQQIALACASHDGEKFHTDLAGAWLKQLGLPESALACGAHAPGDLETARDYIRKDLAPTAKVNNCSGKHLGLLTTCFHLGYSVEGYEKFDHPIQKLQRSVLSPIFQCDLDQSEWGVDGCGIPTSKIPLLNLALGMREILADNPNSEIIRKSITAHPEYIGGHADLSSQVILQTRGQALVKTGAEGVFCGVLPKQKLAFALKVEDGATRASEAAVVFLLKQLGLLEIQFETGLKNWKGDLVGDIQVEIK